MTHLVTGSATLRSSAVHDRRPHDRDRARRQIGIFLTAYLLYDLARWTIAGETGRFGLCEGGFSRVERGRVALSCSRLRSIWTPYWTPSHLVRDARACP